MNKIVNEEPTYVDSYFRSDALTVKWNYQILNKIKIAEEKILETIAKWFSEGSQWVVVEVLHHYINIASYIPLKPKLFFPLPEELRNSKKGLINLQNTDNTCFLWCHVRHPNPAKHNPQRITMADKEFAQKLDYSGISFPVQIKDVCKIENQNSININIFGYESERLYPIRISE